MSIMHYRNVQKNWKELIHSSFTAAVPINTPTTWSIVHSFIECMKEKKKLRKEVLLKAIQNEISEHEAWYEDTVSEGDFKQAVEQYIRCGTCNDEIAFLILSVLANVYNVTMIILKENKNENGSFHFDKEFDYIPPKRTKESNAKIFLTVDDNGWYRPLVNVTGKCIINIQSVKY